MDGSEEPISPEKEKGKFDPGAPNSAMISGPGPEAELYDIDSTVGDEKERCLSMDDDQWMRRIDAGRRYLDGLIRLSASNWMQWLSAVRKTIATCGARETFPLVSAAIWKIGDVYLREKIRETLVSTRPSFLELCSAVSAVFSTPASVSAAMDALSNLKQAEDESMESYLHRFEILYLAIGSFRLDRLMAQLWARYIVVGLSTTRRVCYLVSLFTTGP